jgi:hypothetical protein
MAQQPLGLARAVLRLAATLAGIFAFASTIAALVQYEFGAALAFFACGWALLLWVEAQEL